MIESVNNEKVKYWTKLNEKKYQNSENIFLIEGIHLVEEAKKRELLREVILLEGENFNFDKITYVTESVMKKISSLQSAPKIIGVVEKKKKAKIFGRVLLLDAIQNPGNMGTIIRSAVAFGIDTIVVGAGSVSIYNPKVIRATEGMLFSINIVERDLKEAITELKRQNYQIFITDVQGGEDISLIKPNKLFGIVIGNEGKGVNPEIKELADKKLYIKMSDMCESLNAGVATSIILWI